MRPQVGEDAAAVLHDAAFRVLGHEPDVGLQREREPEADGMAVDRGDHRLADLPRVEVERIGTELRRLGCREGVAATLQVGAGTERASRAREHQQESEKCSHSSCIQPTSESVTLGWNQKPGVASSM